jgi:hypothetical protein
MPILYVLSYPPALLEMIDCQKRMLSPCRQDFLFPFLFNLKDSLTFLEQASKNRKWN